MFIRLRSRYAAIHDSIVRPMPLPSAGKMIVRYQRFSAPFRVASVNASGNSAWARNTSGSMKTELKPMALCTAAHHTTKRIQPPIAFDSSQARPQQRAFHQEMAKFIARTSINMNAPKPLTVFTPFWKSITRAYGLAIPGWLHSPATTGRAESAWAAGDAVMAGYVALLYSIGLPQGRRLIMADLVEMALSLGLDAPRTMAASGNLIFESVKRPVREFEAELEQAFEKKFGKSVAIVVRTGPAWKRLAANNPFAGEGDVDPKTIAVRVMRAPLAESASSLLSKHLRDEQIAVVDGDLWIRFKGDPGSSKLLGAASRMAGAIGTFRTLNSVQKIEAML